MQRPELRPGTTAPIAGTYEQLNIFGRSTGFRATVAGGHVLPAAPQGHNWILVEEAAPAC